MEKRSVSKLSARYLTPSAFMREQHQIYLQHIVYDRNTDHTASCMIHPPLHISHLKFTWKAWSRCCMTMCEGEKKKEDNNLVIWGPAVLFNWHGEMGWAKYINKILPFAQRVSSVFLTRDFICRMCIETPLGVFFITPMFCKTNLIFYAILQALPPPSSEGIHNAA